MRAALRDILGTRAGAVGRALLAWRTRAAAERLLDRRGVREAAATIAREAGDVVLAGPFAGMRYPRRRGDIVHAAKLVGSYERELHDSLEALIARQPALVVNVGSGDGYYAVGLARRLPGTRVVAVDPDPLAQRAARATASLNGVGAQVRDAVRVSASELGSLLAAAAEPVAGPAAGSVEGPAPGSVAGPAAGAGLSAPPHALCVADCEGFEDDLLDPARAPALRCADLIVETHDFARPGVTARLASRFAATHRVVGLEVMVRDATDYPSLRALEPATASALLDEYRHMPQSWLVMTPH
jgi:hypothetical protein